MHRRIGTARFALLVSIAGLAAGVVVAETTVQDLGRAARLADRGDRALEFGRIERARTEYLKAIDIAPLFPEAWIGLGNIAMHEERFGEALEAYRSALRGYSVFANALNAFRSRRYTTAQAELTDLQDAIITLQNPSTSRGDAAYQISKIENRMTRLQSVLPPQVDDRASPPGEIYFLIGNALYRLERIDEAIEQWTTCRQLAPRFGAAANNLAIATLQLGRVDEARGHLADAEELGFPVHPQLVRDVRETGPD